MGLAAGNRLPGSVRGLVPGSAGNEAESKPESRGGPGARGQRRAGPLRPVLSRGAEA